MILSEKKLKKIFFCLKKFINSPWLILLLINIFFFFPLFFPHLKLIITPEYGGGDQNIFHYPIKFFFQQKINQKQSLFWTRLIGGGYPIFTISEVGVFNPINFFTLKFLPFPLAINVQIFISFLILLYFSYWLARVFKLSKISSIFYATVFSYCFFNIANIIHLSHLSSFVYIPGIFAITVKFINDKEFKLRYLLILILLLTLQVISGHQQYFFYSLLLIFLYIVINFILNQSKRKEIILKSFIIFISLIFAFLLSAFQIIPTIEYYQYSNRRIFNNIKYSSVFNLVDLLTFFYPFISYSNNLIKKYFVDSFLPPWDGNFYFGIFPFLLFFFLVLKNRFVNWKKLLKNFNEIIFLIIIFFILVFGDNSPLYFVYDLFPFNLFRVPERITFLLLLMVTLVVSYIFNQLWLLSNKLIKYFLILLAILNFLGNIYIMYSFHIFGNYNQLLKKNEIIKILKESKGRFLSLLFYEEKIPFVLFQKGTKSSYFKNLILIKNSLPQNMNFYYNLESYNLPSSAFNLNRHFYFYNMMLDDEEIFTNRLENKTASLSAQAQHMFKIANIKYILSPYRLRGENTDLKLIKHFKDHEVDFYYYQTKNPSDRIYFSNKFKKIKTLEEFKYMIKQSSDIVYVENDFPGLSPNFRKSSFDYKIIKDTDNHIVINTNSNVKGVMVLADNYYPGWKAYVDGREVKIFRANFVFKGIILSEGRHQVTFDYQPVSLFFGIKLSILTVIILSVILITILRKYPRFL